MDATRRAIISLPFASALAPVCSFAQSVIKPANDDTVRAANAEGGLLVYSIASAENWKPVINRFNAIYPQIKVQTLDLASQSEPFERYLAEIATNSKTADLICCSGKDYWANLYKRGEILPYGSPEAVGLERWMSPVPGLYATSCTPVGLVWNNALVREQERPKDFTQFVELVKSKGAQWRGKLATYTPLAPFGRDVHQAYANFGGEKAWDQYSVLAATTPRFERSGGAMVEKILSGEYVAGWFIAMSTILPRLNDPVRRKLLGWSLVGKGEPLLATATAIPRASRSPNAARLMVDFMLSAEGQRTLAAGGLTVTRPGMKPTGDAQLTYTSIAEAVGGSANIALVDVDPATTLNHEDFLSRYKKLFSI
jgi:iron(III) transport system substrate-binding protein